MSGVVAFFLFRNKFWICMKTTLLSAGIDIGTTTTQVVFSRLRLENVASSFTVPRVEIVGKEVVYRGDVHLTPLLSENRLDGQALRRIVLGEFRRAGFGHKDTDTGAVIITGEAARKENARLVLAMTSELAGDFVVASAGPDMESVIAGKGSGAQRYSRENACVVANLDVGGGTTNIAVFSSGEMATTGCYDIGGRQIRLSDAGLVEYVSASAKQVARHVGVDVRVGQHARQAGIAGVAAGMNEALEQALGAGLQTDLPGRLRTSGSSRLSLPPRIDAVCFSGGVADCIYEPKTDDFAYRDMGVLLGRAIAAGELSKKYRLIVPGETIRATVIGAGSYSTTVSGSTVGYSEGVLPRKSLYAFRLSREAEDELYRGSAAGLEAGIDRMENAGHDLAFCLRGCPNPTYRELRYAADGIATASDNKLPSGAPVFVVVEQDMGKALSLCLERALAGRRAVVSIDGISPSDGDYLDLGRPVMDGIAIPVVVKTLVFG